MKFVSRVVFLLSLACVGPAPAQADEFGTKADESMSGACRTGLDGVTTCIRIRGYVRAGDAFPAPSPLGGAFAPPRLGFSVTGLGSEPQPSSTFGPVRVYIDGGSNGSR